MRYLCWLQEQQFDHPAHQITLQKMVEAVRLSMERVERLEKVIEEFYPPGLSRLSFELYRRYEASIAAVAVPHDVGMRLANTQ